MEDTYSQTFIVRIELWGKPQEFEIMSVQDNGELMYKLSHKELGEQSMRIDMESGNLLFVGDVDENWQSLEDEIGKAIEAKNL